jgi:hypothetical protein
MRFDTVFTAVIMSIVAFCVVVPHILVSDYQRFNPEDGGDTFLRNSGYHVQESEKSDHLTFFTHM